MYYPINAVQAAVVATTTTDVVVTVHSINNSFRSFSRLESSVNHNSVYSREEVQVVHIQSGRLHFTLNCTESPFAYPN